MLKMRAVIPLLVLLFSMCGAQTQSTQTEVQTESQSTGAAAAAAVTTQLDVFAELRDLTVMVHQLNTTVAELSVTLSFTQNELNNTKALLYTVEAENDALHTEVAVLKDSAAQKDDLRSVSKRLAATETDIEHVKNDTTAQHKDLTTMKTEVMNLRMETAAQEAELTAVKTRLAATETDVVNLEKEITDQPQVAFSVGLGDGYTEAGNTAMNLVFTRIITNVGQAYSSITGFFTAPVKGVYYFRFTVLDILSSNSMVIRMRKNGEQIVYLYNYDAGFGSRNYLSSGATLQLEVGDVVNMQLPASKRLYDDASNYCTFSGFLLFPL